MYIPNHFEPPNIDAMHQLIKAYPLATVITQSATGLNANHIPFYLADSPAPFGTLQGHVARANSLLSDIENGTEVLIIFHGPDVYITPSWYATKQESGKVVPTWNYAVVHAYGVLRAVEDVAWLREQLAALTGHNESSFAEPWAVTDAPPEYIDKIMAAIVGVEMVITRLTGKWKVSQNQPVQNLDSLITGLQATGHTNSEAMARLVEIVSRHVR